MTINIGIATNPFRESFQRAFEQEIEIIKPNPKLDEIVKYDLVIFSGGEDIIHVFTENLIHILEELTLKEIK